MLHMHMHTCVDVHPSLYIDTPVWLPLYLHTYTYVYVYVYVVTTFDMQHSKIQTF